MSLRSPRPFVAAWTDEFVKPSNRVNHEPSWAETTLDKCEGGLCGSKSARVPDHCFVFQINALHCVLNYEFCFILWTRRTTSVVLHGSEALFLAL